MIKRNCAKNGPNMAVAAPRHWWAVEVHVNCFGRKVKNKNYFLKIILTWN